MPKDLIDQGSVNDASTRTLDRAVRRLDRLEKRELSQTRILVQLLGRDRSVADLVAMIYEKKPQDPGYRSLYMRVSRRLRSLQERGLVSRALFGKERPYRITRLGKRALTLTIAQRSPLNKDEEVEAVWGKPQSAIVLAAGLLLFVVVICKASAARTILAYGFFLLLGSSIVIAAYALREVL